eukprot:Protomagalhaensia_wolfi_Nauph_80__1854@NODE_2158_length_1191_cov_36_839410_g1688_i0_p1_GENE_NODE_2158_length_1191_cov_36_839410_g1688_i0NODE_2158_length_1191_cov_36_839410_g1688_i0_p1_ORF_typecomplete_len123_score20_96_NODE_2158_length_1191_cov_36_839410_g1688_i0347715
MALALPDDCALQGVTFYQGIILEDYDWCIDALEVHPSIVLTGPDLMILKHNEIRFDRLDQETMNIAFIIQYSDTDCGSDCDADVPSPFTCNGEMEGEYSIWHPGLFFVYWFPGSVISRSSFP